jgi:hypothetical protein
VFESTSTARQNSIRFILDFHYHYYIVPGPIGRVSLIRLGRALLRRAILANDARCTLEANGSFMSRARREALQVRLAELEAQ